MRKFLIALIVGTVILSSFPVFAKDENGTGTTNVEKQVINVQQEQLKNIQLEKRTQQIEARENIKASVQEQREAVKTQVQEKREEVKTQIQANRTEVKDKIQAQRQEAITQFQEKRQAAVELRQEKKQEIQAQLQAKKEERQQQIQQKKEDLRVRLQEIKDARKQQAIVRINNHVDVVNERAVNHFTNVLDRLEEILAKIKERADKIVANDVDVTAVRAAITTAENSIASSRSSVVAQAAKTYAIEITSEETLRSDVETVIQAMKGDLESVQTTTQSARDAVHSALRSLVQIPRVNDYEVGVDASSVTQ
ncbi:MAG: hypothetical protein V1652_02835 [bacterium]